MERHGRPNLFAEAFAARARLPASPAWRFWGVSCYLLRVAWRSGIQRCQRSESQRASRFVGVFSFEHCQIFGRTASLMSGTARWYSIFELISFYFHLPVKVEKKLWEDFSNEWVVPAWELTGSALCVCEHPWKDQQAPKSWIFREETLTLGDNCSLLQPSGWRLGASVPSSVLTRVFSYSYDVIHHTSHV